jgi:hypothetical protein
MEGQYHTLVEKREKKEKERKERNSDTKSFILRESKLPRALNGIVVKLDAR